MIIESVAVEYEEVDDSVGMRHKLKDGELSQYANAEKDAMHKRVYHRVDDTRCEMNERKYGRTRDYDRELPAGTKSSITANMNSEKTQLLDEHRQRRFNRKIRYSLTVRSGIGGHDDVSMNRK